MAKRRRAKRWLALALILAVLGAAGVWFVGALRPLSLKKGLGKNYLRFEEASPLSLVLNNLQQRKLIRSGLALNLLARIEGRSATVPAGTYDVTAAMNGEEVLRELRSPITLFLRLPETNWANRTAHLLAEYQVVNADDYMSLVRDPKQFQGEVPFPLPKASLEGYLYPKRYEFPPLYGAKRVILDQLKEFEQNVWRAPDRPKDLPRTLIIASLVQLEAGKDVDRPMIAGIIENRLKKKMPLQIDATILYALQKWRRLTFKDYKSVHSPYNTYLTKGLPPGPICSPDEKDIEAAAHPAKHNYLYYVALPDGHSIYAATYPEHLKNIAIRKAAILAVKKNALKGVNP